jgi:ATP-dependent protease ClpP protease subunit
MKNRIEVKAQSATEATIYIYGDIGDSFFDEEAQTAASVRNQLAALGDVTDITVRINSRGGNVFDGLAIYNLLKDHPASVLVKIDGLAASIASVIAMAGDLVVMPATAKLMIHDPHVLARGNSTVMRKVADILDEIRDSLLAAYVDKTGQPEDDIRQLMSDETWMGADRARELGFVDEQTNEDPQIENQFDMTWFKNAPEGLQVTAQAASEQPSTNHEVNDMADNTNTPDNAVKADEIRAEALAAEKQRRADIRAAFERHDQHDELMNTCLDDPEVTVETARAKLLDALGADATPSGGVVAGRDEAEKFQAAAADWLIARNEGKTGELDRDNPARGMSLLDLARNSLERAGVSTRGMVNVELAKAAITHSTSDFPVVLEEALHKTLLSAYRTAPDTWRRFCAVGTLNDFRPHNRYRMGSIANLQKVLENGEFKDTTLSDAEKESIQGDTKGLILNLSRQIIINDDLGAFLGVARQLARAAGRTIEADVFALFAMNGGNGPTMEDGNPLFHADHNNIAGSGSVPTMSAFEAARVQMAQQKDPSGNDFLDLRPDIWLGPLSLGGQARQVNAAEYDDEAQKNQRKPNISRGMVSDIVDTPRLTGDPWYMLADPADAPTFEVAFLNGQQEPFADMVEGFRVDGVSWKIRHDYGVAAVDYRGAIKNPGT